MSAGGSGSGGPLNEDPVGPWKSGGTGDVPAFPWNFEVDHGEATLRDWFAGLALQALAADYPTKHGQFEADQAYRFADAMLRARERKEP